MKKGRRTARASTGKTLKDTTIRLRVSAEDKEVIMKAAKRDGLELSAWLRRLALKEAGALPEAK
jgi:uncharacterized protein (DUF1778 family)